MKKNYIAPNTVERKVVLHQMITTSEVGITGLDGFGGYGGNGSGKTPGSRSKGWDDEDDF